MQYEHFSKFVSECAKPNFSRLSPHSTLVKFTIVKVWRKYLCLNDQRPRNPNFAMTSPM